MNNINFTSYQGVIDWMLQQLPMFSRVGNIAYKPSLDNITALCNALGNPHHKFKSIHIAGTNGKGSTSHILAATFQEAGYKVGLYTSPHLMDLRERMRINGALIDAQFIIDFINQNQEIIQELKPSYFEINVAMAFAAFANEKVDIAIIETGLGGRLDGTNIIMPELSVITNISFDHVDLLGDTLPKIAGEKAGIIKENIPVVIGESQEETEPVFFQKAHLLHAPIRFADELYDIIRINQDEKTQYFKFVNKVTQKITSFQTDLLGVFQSKNIVTAYAAIQVMEQQGWNVNEDIFFKAIMHIKQLTKLRGRWDWIQTNPNIILDVGHNIAGIVNLKEQLTQDIFKKGEIHILMGFVADKDVNGVLDILPKNVKYHLSQAQIPRALPVETLAQLVAAHNLDYDAYPTVTAAVLGAKKQLNTDDTLIIIGSFFIVAEAMEYFENQ